jgi:hypothetical protein
MNPELRRNIQIELTPQRLLLPLVIAGILYWTLNESLSITSAQQRASHLFLWAFGGIAIFWGGRLANESATWTGAGPTQQALTLGAALSIVKPIPFVASDGTG